MMVLPQDGDVSLFNKELLPAKNCQHMVNVGTKRTAGALLILINAREAAMPDFRSGGRYGVLPVF